MYENRITTSGVKYRTYPMHDYNNDRVIEIPVINEKITPQQSLRLLVSEGCINVNFELSRAEFGDIDAMKEPGRLLAIPLSPELREGFKFGEPRGEFKVLWVTPSALDDATNVVISARISVAEGLENLMRRAGL